MGYISEHSLLDEYQSSYRTGHSAQTALLELTDDIRLGLNRRRVTLVFLFDFSKVFDTVSYVILLRKLTVVGFANSVLKWIA